MFYYFINQTLTDKFIEEININYITEQNIHKTFLKTQYIALEPMLSAFSSLKPLTNSSLELHCNSKKKKKTLQNLKLDTN